MTRERGFASLTSSQISISLDLGDRRHAVYMLTADVDCIEEELIAIDAVQ